MRNGEIMGLRDPHGFLHQFILDMGFDDQEDQPLLDQIALFTRDQALLIFHILDTRLQSNVDIPHHELKDLILNLEGDEMLAEKPIYH